MKRPGQLAEVAPAYVVLASLDCSYFTGQTIYVNGGDIAVWVATAWQATLLIALKSQSAFRSLSKTAIVELLIISDGFDGFDMRSLSTQES